MYEINGNLSELKKYPVFQMSIGLVVKRFYDLFGEDLMNKQKFYVDNCFDNGTANCGYTPIITKVLKEFLVIKLGIDDFGNIAKTIYQFAHELTHFVFFCIKGLDKEFADDAEETICTAMSLIMLKTFCDDETFNSYCRHVRSLKYTGYKDGYDLALSLDFNEEKIAKYIIENN